MSFMFNVVFFRTSLTASAAPFFMALTNANMAKEDILKRNAKLVGLFRYNLRLAKGLRRKLRLQLDPERIARESVIAILRAKLISDGRSGTDPIIKSFSCEAIDL